MAVGFFPPDEDERFDSSFQSPMVVTTNSATQTPLQSPVNREFLVQVFCEALNRCSISGKFFVFYIFLFRNKFVHSLLSRNATTTRTLFCGTHKTHEMKWKEYLFCFSLISSISRLENVFKILWELKKMKIVHRNLIRPIKFFDMKIINKCYFVVWDEMGLSAVCLHEFAYKTVAIMFRRLTMRTRKKTNDKITSVFGERTTHKWNISIGI